MDYEIEDFEPMPEQEFEEQLEMPLDGTVSVMELAQQRMTEMLEAEQDNATETIAGDSSGMPALADLLAGCQAYPASPTAIAKIQKQMDSQDHPLYKLNIGECFTLTLSWFSKSDMAKLRSSVGMFANRNGRRFTILSHKDMDILEIARIQ